LEAIAVIDFETTGLSPGYGDRATEIAAILVRDGRIVDRYQSLMNAGVSIPAFITGFTGITNAMVRKAPPARQVMAEVADFVGDYPLVAHNASFDSKFWDAELERIGRVPRQGFICSMLVARRVLPQAPNHKLGTLVDFAKLPVTGSYHRAQADAEMTAHLVLYLERELMRRFGLGTVSCQLLAKIQKTPANRLEHCVARFGKGCV
jgi:DNA polymerase-3 subunit epsilon